MTTLTLPDSQPGVGRQVHYYDRQEIVAAHDEGRDPAPYAATITRINRGPDGVVLDVVTLAVLDPEIGVQIHRDVRQGEYSASGQPLPQPQLWYWPPRIDQAPAAAQPGRRKG